MTIHIAVMDYSSGTIKMYSPDLNNDTEEIEEWLHENTDYTDSNCYYMSSTKKIEVRHLQEKRQWARPQDTTLS